MWRDWYESCFPRVLQENEVGLRAKGIRIERVLSTIAGEDAPWSPEQREKQKKSLQSHVTAPIRDLHKPDPTTGLGTSSLDGDLATNIFRRIGGTNNREHAKDAINQFIIQGAMGHRASSQFLDQRWAAPIAWIS